MKGTEKQIAWAEDIQKAAIETINTVMEQAKADPKYNPNDPMMAAMIEKWESRRSAIEACDYAGDLINLFSRVSPKNSAMENLKALKSAYKVNGANTEGEAALLIR